MDEQTKRDGLWELVHKLKESYEEFAEAVEQEESKRDVGSFFQKLMGGFNTTRTDLLCDDFLEEVQKQMPVLEKAMEEAEPADAAEACGAVADIMLCSNGEQINGSAVLMKRALVSQFLPLVPYLTDEKLEECHDRMIVSYRKCDLLPVEKQLIRTMEQRMKQK